MILNYAKYKYIDKKFKETRMPLLNYSTQDLNDLHIY